MPLQSPSLGSAQAGTSCRQSTSGSSALASRTISARNARRSGGTALPWKTFQVRISTALYSRPVFRRRRFADIISRQLELFERDSAELIRECEAAEEAYDQAERDEAEERFGDYQDLVETGTEILADLRDHFAATLDEAAGEQYEAEFNEAVRRRLPRFGLEIENR